jgi:hypothetical protein
MHIDVNKAYETLVGWSTDELLTMGYLEIMPEDEQPDGAVARAKEVLQERGKYGPFSAVFKKKKTESDSTQTIKVTLNWVRIRWQNRDFIWSLCWPRPMLPEVPLGDDFPLPELSPPMTAVLGKMGQVPLEPPPPAENPSDKGQKPGIKGNGGNKPAPKSEKPDDKGKKPVDKGNAGTEPVPNSDKPDDKGKKYGNKGKGVEG